MLGRQSDSVPGQMRGGRRIADDDPIQPAPTLYSVLAIDGALIFRRGDVVYRVDSR